MENDLYQPPLTMTDDGPLAGSDGCDPCGISDQAVPGLAGGGYDIRRTEPAESRREPPFGRPRVNESKRPKPDMTGSAYSITSSARARINGGIVRPSALVDDEIECGRLLNRKISRLISLQGAVDIASGAAKDVENAG